MNPLQVFPRHPSAPDTYYINGAWAPAAITAVDKRFSAGELAAEYWAACAERPNHMREFRPNVWLFETEILDRFAALPHHDDGPA